MIGWEPIASHGDSPHRVEAAIERLNGLALNEMRRELLLKGLGEAVVNHIAAVVERRLADQLEQDLPRIMVDMRETARKE